MPMLGVKICFLKINGQISSIRPSSDLSEFRPLHATGVRSDVSQSIPVITSPAAPPTARVKCRKPTTPLRTTRTI
eukprot:7103519-Pyramimonas_sp.AAC.1